MATDLTGAEQAEPTPPLPGSVWCHTRSNTDYVVDMLTNVDSHDPEQFPLTVVYHRLGDLSRWSRTWEEFKLKFTLV